MRALTRLLLLSVFPILSGCVTSSETRIQEALGPWVGQSTDRLVEAWGAPDANFALESGAKVLTYDSERSTTRTVGLGYSRWRYDSYTYNDRCRINFVTDVSQKKLERFSTTGQAYGCADILRDAPRP